MHLTRMGFNALVIVWLAPLVMLDFVGNTISTGFWSDVFFYKMLADGLLVGYAFWECSHGQTTSLANAKARVADRHDDVVSFENIGAIEYVYCVVLCVYAIANFVVLHGMNKESTGLESIATLAWSFVSLAVAILAAVQFWHLKSGKIVELTHKVVN
jgi:hypothetical protein